MLGRAWVRGRAAFRRRPCRRRKDRGEGRGVAAQLLGSEVTGRPQDYRIHGESWLCHGDGEAEVAEQQVRVIASGGTQQQVGGLDVSVHDAAGVDGFKRGKQLVEQRGGPFRGQRTEVSEEAG